jgi:hypothetical protein
VATAEPEPSSWPNAIEVEFQSCARFAAAAAAGWPKPGGCVIVNPPRIHDIIETLTISYSTCMYRVFMSINWRNPADLLILLSLCFKVKQKHPQHHQSYPQPNL